MRAIKKIIAHNKKGQSLVEMALIAPLLLLMFMGVIEVGWALRNFVVAQNSTREAARFAARGRYLDFSETDVNEIGYQYVIQHQLDSIAGELPLDVTPGTANATVIVSHILVDTGLVEMVAGTCQTSAADDIVLSPDTSGYGHYQATFGLPNTSHIDFAALGDEMRVENEAFNCELAARTGNEYVPSVNSAIVVETFYGHELLVGVPLIAPLLADENGKMWMYTKTIMRISSDARGQVSSAGQGCEAYPIAMHTSVLDSMQPGDSTGDIFNGAGAGQFGWMRWNGDTSEAYLAEEFANPRLAHNDFTNALDSEDHALTAGDSAWGSVGAVSDSDIADELDSLINGNTTIRIPVWDSIQGSGATLSYHIDRFVQIQITDYDLSSNWVRATFIGEDPNACPDIQVSVPTETPTATATWDPSLPTPTATETATATPTETSTATPTPTMTEAAPVGCDSPLPPAGTTWTSLDIGGAAAGYTGEQSGTVYVCGSGNTMWGTADMFRYVYQVVSDDNVEFTARISDWDGSVNGWSKGGIMIRNSTSPSSAFGMLVLSGSNGMRMQWRSSDSADAQDHWASSASAPVWVRLVKHGTSMSAYWSTNGSSWNLVATETVNLGSTFLVGFAVASRDNGLYAHASYDQITIDTTVPIPTPTFTLTPATPEDIATDDFESGGGSGGTGWSGNWNFSGEARVTYRDGPHAGGYHLRVRADDGVATRQVDMTGVSSARLQFWWKARSFESGETATVRVYDGSWHTVLTVGEPQDDEVHRYADIDISSYNMGSDFRVEVASHMSGDYDYFYIDDLVIEGIR